MQPKGRRLKSGCGENMYSQCGCKLFIEVMCIVYALSIIEYIGISEVNKPKGSTRNLAVYLLS